MTIQDRVVRRFTAQQKLARHFPGWTEYPGEHFPERREWRKDDGTAEVIDSGRKGVRQRFRIVWIRDGKRLEGLGWPSLKSAILYAQGDIRDKDHPLFREKPSDRAWNEAVRKENEEFLTWKRKR